MLLVPVGVDGCLVFVIAGCLRTRDARHKPTSARGSLQEVYECGRYIRPEAIRTPHSNDRVPRLEAS